MAPPGVFCGVCVARAMRAPKSGRVNGAKIRHPAAIGQTLASSRGYYGANALAEKDTPMLFEGSCGCGAVHFTVRSNAPYPYLRGF